MYFSPFFQVQPFIHGSSDSRGYQRQEPQSSLSVVPRNPAFAEFITRVFLPHWIETDRGVVDAVTRDESAPTAPQLVQHLSNLFPDRLLIALLERLLDVDGTPERDSVLLLVGGKGVDTVEIGLVKLKHIEVLSNRARVLPHSSVRSQRPPPTSCHSVAYVRTVQPHWLMSESPNDRATRSGPR